jgi:hypothetical protein
MKNLSLISIIFIAACGSSGTSNTQNGTPTPLAQNITSPSPSPACDSALVGNWISESGNSIEFNSDCSVSSQGGSLVYSLNNNNIDFSMSDGTQIDVCGYEILTAGGLIVPLVVTLDLTCQKSGPLSYTKTK